MELREFHRVREEKGSRHVVRPGEVVTIYDENHPRGWWRLGRIECLIVGADGVVRGVRVRVASKEGHTKSLHRPLQHIYPLEVGGGDPEPDKDVTSDKPADATTDATADGVASTVPKHLPVSRRPTRAAAVHARDRILGCLTDD